MKREVELAILEDLMRQRESGRNVDAGVMYRNPTEAYTSKEIAAQEYEVFFRDHPQLIGLSGSLPGPGTFMTVDDFGVPVLATRDRDGVFRAFVNACRHRGARVAEGAGERARFVCPFHNWTYTAKGELAGIPLADQVGDVDKSCHGLIALPAVEKGGLLWVHPRADGEIDLDRQLADLAPEIDSWGFGDLVYTQEAVIDGRLNWKLANDTFGETYHFSRLHKNTLGQIFQGDVLGYEEFGRNHRFVIATRGLDAMREKPQSEWDMMDGTSPLYYLFPNIQLSFSRTSASVIKMYPHPDAPLDPSRSRTRVLHYFAQDVLDRAAEAEAGKHDAHLITGDNAYDERTDRDAFVVAPSALAEVFDSTIEQEDYLMGTHQQRAAESGQLEHVIFGRNEPALHHYHQHFREALGMTPLERIGE